MQRLLEDFHDFKSRQRNKDGSLVKYVIAKSAVSPRDGGTVQVIYFQNGASSDGYWRHAEVPSDPVALLRAKRNFLVAQIDAEVRDWNLFKHHSLEMAELNKRFSNLPAGVTPAALAVLVQGQKVIEDYRKQLAQIDAQLADTAEEQAVSAEEIREQARLDEERRRQQDLITTVKSLSV
jgi:hypothetical protein